jgi:ankyrin repeat-rich membrane spanning protein
MFESLSYRISEEMKSFARQWLNPMFTWNILILIVSVCFSSIVGVIAGLAIQNWIVGVSFCGGLVVIIHTVLLCIWLSSKRSK